MNPVNDLLQQAIQAVRSGNKKEGAQKLAQVVQQDQRNAEAWYWLAQATDDPNEAAACLRRVLKIDPNYSRAKEALAALEKGGVTIQDVPTPAAGYGTPYDPSATQSMRPLNTGELLGASGGFDTPYGSYTPPSSTRQDAPTRAMPNIPTPPPPPFGDTFTPAPAPATFGNDPTPPPPFGMPAWANQAGSAPGGGTSQRPNDPYAGTAGGPPPPPPFATPGSGTGLRFSQLDPAAAQAAAEAQAAAAQPLDPNADLRARLLGNQAVPVNQPPPIQPTGQRTFIPDPNLRQQPVQKKKSRISPLLGVVLAIAVLVMAVVAVIYLTQNTGQTQVNAVDASATAGAALSITPGALTPSPGAGTPSTAAGTTSTTTNATAAIATTATSGATTTAGVGTTTAGVATTTAGIATTAAAPSPTVARPLTTVGATATVARPLTTATGATPTPTLPGATSVTTAPPPPTPVPPKPTTAPPPTVATTASGAATPVATPNTQGAPQEVKDYVDNAFNLIGALGFVEDNVNRLVIQPYRDGKFKDKPLDRNAELGYYQVEMGQIARKLKDALVPEGAFELQVLATDYATHLGEMSNMIDLYISTGQTFYADRAAIYYDKAKSERLLWLKTVQQGYPYKVSLA